MIKLHVRFRFFCRSLFRLAWFQQSLFFICDSDIGLNFEIFINPSFLSKSPKAHITIFSCSMVLFPFFCRHFPPSLSTLPPKGLLLCQALIKSLDTNRTLRILVLRNNNFSAATKEAPFAPEGLQKGGAGQVTGV